MVPGYKPLLRAPRHCISAQNYEWSLISLCATWPFWCLYVLFARYSQLKKNNKYKPTHFSGLPHRARCQILQLLRSNGAKETKRTDCFGKYLFSINHVCVRAWRTCVCVLCPVPTSFFWVFYAVRTVHCAWHAWRIHGVFMHLYLCGKWKSNGAMNKFIVYALHANQMASLTCPTYAIPRTPHTPSPQTHLTIALWAFIKFYARQMKVCAAIRSTW